MNSTVTILGAAALHDHRLYDRPEIRGAGCTCGIVWFGSASGPAEYNPSAKITVHAHSRKTLWEEGKS